MIARPLYVRRATDWDSFHEPGEPIYSGSGMGLLQLWHAARAAADGGVARDRHGYPLYDRDGFLARRLQGTHYHVVCVRDA